MNRWTLHSLPVLVVLAWAQNFTLGQDTASVVVVNRGPSHRSDQTVTEHVGPGGLSIRTTNVMHSLASGLHRWDPGPPGQWVESVEAIEVLDNRAVVRQLPYQLIVEPNLNHPLGAVDLLTADNQRLRSRPVGLALYDDESELMVFIGTLKDTVGELLGNTQILFRDAFEGTPGLRVDLLLSRTSRIRPKPRPWARCDLASDASFEAGNANPLRPADPSKPIRFNGRRFAE